MNEFLEEMYRQADALYLRRSELAAVRRSVELLSDALADYGALWRLGRAHFFLGQETHDEKLAREHHVAGARACERAARLSSNGVEGHFWLGVNLGLLAGLEKGFDALKDALRAKRALRRAVQLEPAYHAAGPLRVLARLESRLPLILGGGFTRSRKHFEEAVHLAPANTVTRLYFAEMLVEHGEHERARIELEALLNAPDDAAWAFEIKRDKARAQELLRKSKSR